MKIEILFNEVCNLYGDSFNARFLSQSLPEAEFFYTGLNDKPHFTNEDIDFIYMGSMPEITQEHVISRLLPYRECILESIKSGKVFLFTGNAFEVFGEYILDDEKGRITALNIFDGYAKRNMWKRYNALFLGESIDEEGNSIRIVGFKNQFTHYYMNNENCYAFKCLRGCGINPDSIFEGIRLNNFFGTYLIGPLLVLNPLFTKYLLSLAGVKDTKLAFEDVAMEAYRVRLKEFEDENRKILL